MADLLKLRKAMKKRKPKFFKQDYHKKAKIKWKWKKPRGKHSKIRLCKSGHRKMVRKGYCSPRAVYGLHPTGFREVIVRNTDDFKKINPKEDGAVIAADIGTKRRIALLKKAKETNITVLNFKDIDKFLNSVEEKRKAAKEEKEKRKLAKETKKKEKEKKAEKKEEKLAEKITEEERKEKEKEEKDKVLTKREI